MIRCLGRGAWIAILAVLFMLTGAAPGCGKSKAVVGQQADKANVPLPSVAALPKVTPAVVGEPPMWDGGIVGVAGPAHDEVEPDDDRTSAMVLPLDASVRGSLATADDVDVYRVHVDGRGVLRVALEAMAKTDAILEIADGQGTLLAKSDRGGAGVAEGIPNLGVVPGDYFVTVRAFTKSKKSKHDDDKSRRKKTKASEPVVEAPATYRLGASWSAAAPVGGEIEPDDEVAVANDLTLGDAASGYLGWKDDVDLWRLSLETIGDGVGLDIDVSAVEGVAITVSLVDANGKSWFERRGAKGAAVMLSSLQLPVDVAGPSMWIAIRGDRSNPIAPYSLTVRGRALVPDEEREPNDTEMQATAQAAVMRREPAAATGKSVDAGAGKPAAHAVVDAAVPAAGADAPMLHVVGAVPPGDVDLFEFVAPTAGIAHVELVPNPLLDVTLDIVVHAPGSIASDFVHGKKKSRDQPSLDGDGKGEQTTAGGHSEAGGVGVAESLDVDIRAAGSIVIVHVIPQAARADKSKDKKAAVRDIDALAAGRSPAPALNVVVDELAPWHYELTAVLRPSPIPSANDELPPEEGSDSHGEH